MLNSQEEGEILPPSPKKLHLDQEGAGVMTRRMLQQQQQQQQAVEDVIQPSTSSDRTSQGQPLSPVQDSEDSEEELLPFVDHQLEEEEEASDQEDFYIERPLPKHSFVIEHVKSRSFKHRGIVDEVTYRAKVKHPSATTDLNTLSVEMMVLFNSILSELRKTYKPHSLLRIFITHPDLLSPIIHYPTFIEDLRVEDIMKEIERRLYSAGFIPADAQLEINVAIASFPWSGSGKKREMYNEEDKKLKKSIVEIVNPGDYFCLARAIVVANAHLNKELFKHVGMPSSKFYADIYKRLRDKRNVVVQKEAAMDLMRNSGVPLNREGRVTDLPLYEDFLQRRIVVLSSTCDEKRIYGGNHRYAHTLFLYHSTKEDGKGHFDTIISMSGFITAPYYCDQCKVGYKKRHFCNSKCAVCDRKNCLPLEQKICEVCHQLCKSEECYTVHKVKTNKLSEQEQEEEEEEEEEEEKTNKFLSPCEKNIHCPHCNLNLKKRRLLKHHVCGESYCKTCKLFHQEKHHKCFFRGQTRMSLPEKFLFYDFECTQDQDGEHVPNLVVVQSSCSFCEETCEVTETTKCAFCGSRCDKCIKLVEKIVKSWEKQNIPQDCWDISSLEKEIPHQTCGLRQHIFKGEKTLDKFCEWLFSHQHKNYTVIAHNAKAYDNYFLYDYLINTLGKPPDKLIFVGCKILYMHFGFQLNMRFLDSVNFLPMPLAKIPKSFGLTELHKGFFPHLLNTQENIQNKLCLPHLPPMSFYSPDTMSSERRKEFMQWYEKNQRKAFDLEQEMIMYCISDVDILRRGCVEFRKLFKEATGSEDSGHLSVDPFSCLTIASVCMTVFRTNYIPEKWHIFPKSIQEKRNKKSKCSHDTGTDCRCEFYEGFKKSGGSPLMMKLENHWITARLFQHSIEKEKFISSPVALLPNADPLGRELYSLEALQWLKSVSVENNLSIQTANSPLGEKRVQIVKDGKVFKFQLDGYLCVEGKHFAFEFYGCPFHGCPQCFPTERNVATGGNKSMEQKFKETLLRENLLKENSFIVISKWSCVFNKEKRENPSKWKDFECFSNISLSDCYFGGRTNALSLYKKFDHGEKGYYVDFTSLYPSVLKYAKYPVGHPERICENFAELKESDCTEGKDCCYYPHCQGKHYEFPYFGVVKVTLLPPQNLYIPVLPVRINDKLMFPLCYKCGLKQNQEDCQCSEEERMFTQTYCTPEINCAINVGYKIVKIHQVLHWKESEKYDPESKKGGIFTDYINTFLKVKQEASGFPEGIDDDLKKQEYCDKYYQQEGIQLSKENIVKNPGLRQVAKLALNSFYGKFGQRQIKAQSKLLTKLEDFYSMLTDPSLNITNWHVLTSDILHVEYSLKKNFELPNLFGNVVIAAMCTCWARLELWKVMSKLGERVIYHDTDSIIFTVKSGEYVPPLGDHLGELTSELTCDALKCKGCNQGHWITEFVSCGPKNYAYKTNSRQTVCKVRGFSLNYQNSKILNFEKMKEALDTWYNKSPATFVTVNYLIKRDKYKEPRLKNVEVNKTYGVVYDKRRVLPDYTTVPFGYKKY